MKHTRVKICGITNIEDAHLAVELGTDALGFIFVPDTPRFVQDFDLIASILSSIPPFVTAVAVCSSIAQVPDLSLFHAVQIYSPQDSSIPQGVKLIRAVRVKDEGSLDEIAGVLEQERPHALLLDAYHAGALGGTGAAFNWELATRVIDTFHTPTILAGGLTPENVAMAVSTVHPYAVDVSSGVELAPGKKDPAKLRDFIANVRAVG